MMRLSNHLRTLVAAGATAVALGAMAPAQAGDLPDDDDFVERPQVERRVVVEERRVVQPVYETRTIEERRVVRPAYERRVIERPVVEERRVIERPVVEERRVIERPVVEERRIVERPVFEQRRVVQPAYETGVIERPVRARPVFYGGPAYERPVYGRPVYGGEDCRVVVKQRVNRWGEMIVKRVRICD